MTLREFLNRRMRCTGIFAAIAVALVWSFTILAPMGSLENYLMGGAFVA
jgi:hypothetical protein